MKINGTKKGLDVMTSYYIHAALEQCSQLVSFDHCPTQEELEAKLVQLIKDNIRCGYYINSSDEWDEKEFEEHRLDYANGESNKY